MAINLLAVLRSWFYGQARDDSVIYWSTPLQSHSFRASCLDIITDSLHMIIRSREVKRRFPFLSTARWMSDFSLSPLGRGYSDILVSS